MQIFEKWWHKNTKVIHLEYCKEWENQCIKSIPMEEKEKWDNCFNFNIHFWKFHFWYINADLQRKVKKDSEVKK